MRSNHSPLFSIITATYNSAKTINETIDSLQAQTFKNFEIIIIDGLSTDNTLIKIKNYNDPRIRINSDKDEGIFDALNKGISKANGNIIGFLHSDDTLNNKDTLKVISENFDSGTDGTYGDLCYVSFANPDKIIRNWISNNFSDKSLKFGWMPPHPTLFLRKAVYNKHGSFKLDYKVSSDYDFILRIFKDSNLTFKYIPHIVTNMKLGGNSNRDIKNISIKLFEDYQIIRKNRVGNIFTLFLKNFSKISQFF
jgi:GT2 family glycosyltransferase